MKLPRKIVLTEKESGPFFTSCVSVCVCQSLCLAKESSKKKCAIAVQEAKKEEEKHQKSACQGERARKKRAPEKCCTENVCFFDWMQSQKNLVFYWSNRCSGKGRGSGRGNGKETWTVWILVHTISSSLAFLKPQCKWRGRCGLFASLSCSLYSFHDFLSHTPLSISLRMSFTWTAKIEREQRAKQQ